MAKKQEYDTILFEDARILFRNFEGKEKKFNPPGQRNFCVLLPPNLAGTMEAEGWNVRFLKPREEGDLPQPYLQISVSYKLRPPKIVLISEANRSRTFLDEDSVHILDWADIKTIDFVINPSFWEVNGKSGIKAYLKKMFVTLEEDELELKYADDNIGNPSDDEELD